MLANLERARRVMKREGLDAILLAQPNNFVYATDYLVPSTFSFLDRPLLAVLFRDPGIAAAAVVPGWDLPDFRRRSWVERAVGYAEFATGRDAGLKPDWPSALAAALGDARPARLGIEERYVPKWILEGVQARLPGSALIDAQATIREIRSVKTAEELVRLRRAASIMETAVEAMLGAAQDGVTERSLAQTYATAVSRQGGENIANFVLGFGPDGAYSHCIPGDRALQPGDAVRFDLGARYMGYHADTAVSRFWRGPNAVQARLYRGVLDSQRAAAALLRPGVRVTELYDTAIAVARGFIPAFRMEHVGHGIGVEHHEAPPLIGAGDAVLEADMVINVETLHLDPEQGGFAVEDTYRITRDGADQWTGFDRSARLG